MKRALMTIALLASASIAESQTTRLLVADDSKLVIEGASNVSSWSCRTTTIEATIDVDSADERYGKTIRAVGTLTLAGRENAVRLEIDAARDSAGGFEARGEI